MATEKQINANRQNSQKSTGPRTAHGKTASSKNAVKHGLFANDTVIEGENQADYDEYLDNFLAELEPKGMFETMMAERFICLTWRLKRAERMQNQAIDKLIEHGPTSPLASHSSKLMCQARGIPADEPRYSPDHLPLGRIACNDFADGRILDRLNMYERRIENSMLRTLKEFKKQKVMRLIIEQEMNRQFDRSAFSVPHAGNTNLKKQSQFTADMTGVNPFTKGGYDGYPPLGFDENRPNPPEISMPKRNRRTSQSQFGTSFGYDWLPGAGQPPAGAAG